MVFEATKMYGIWSNENVWYLNQRKCMVFESTKMYGIWINENVWYLKYYNMFKLAVLIVLILELYIYLLISKEYARFLILVPHDLFTI